MLAADSRVFAVPYVCDCGIAWRLMVLGIQQLRAGARVFLGGAEGGGERCWTGGSCDVAVTLCDVRRLEMARPRLESLLLLCLG